MKPGHAYYNEIDSHAARWLGNLIAARCLAPGDVDERSIADVRPDDLRSYGQCHFFAGIGGWSRALRLAGWPDDRPVWTGSCPCQPLSSAGQRQGHADRRHLWPAFHRLIAECRPAVVLGEQVASADGREWLAAVRADLEAAGYAVGAANLPACSVGAPHIRQRLWFVAEGMDDADCAGLLGDACEPRLSPRECAELSGPQRFDQGRAAEQPGRSPWSDCVWLPCTDGKARPAQPGIFPLAHGVPGRMGRLRAYGNAIVPQAAAEFIGAVMHTLEVGHGG